MIRLEAFTIHDFDRLISWIKDEETLIQFGGALFTFPLTIEQLTRYVTDEKRHIYKVVNPARNITLGHAEIYFSEDGIPKLCRILIGEESLRGKGFGKQIIHKLLKISFNNNETKTVELNVFDWNIVAIKCYEKCGFVLNKNVRRMIQVNNKTWASVNMRIDKATWLKNQSILLTS